MNNAIEKMFFILVTILALSINACAQESIDRIEMLPTVLYLAEGDMRRQNLPDEFNIRDINNLSVPSKVSLDLIKSDAALSDEMSNLLAEIMEDNASSLDFKYSRRSQSGSYLEYEQMLNGLPIVGTQVGVSIDQNGELSSVIRTLVQIPNSKAGEIDSVSEIDGEKAIEIAWQDLRVTGEIIEEPTFDQAYLVENYGLTLIFVVRVAVDKPFGYWEYKIDGMSGRIIEKTDRKIDEGKRDSSIDVDSRGQTDQVVDMQAALYAYENRTKQPMKKAGGNATTASAKGFVFDPNPITSLNNLKLVDNSPAKEFTKAYVEVDLQEVALDGNTYSLSGRTVQIRDFERGEGGRSVAPSTSAGKWVAKRGDNAFNDVMTYYYLYKSISYLRSLGYKGDKELFGKAIRVDSDGVMGYDNSHYVPGSDVLAFGHGCVDDNEDADVILHELGHAITYHINPSWGGGDSGAIGEGFSDYWAVSSRIRTNRWSPVANKVFVWDGISDCWPGRRVDRSNATYDPKTTYKAHMNMGQFVSDELWSTPLVQSLRELMVAGETHESVDIIVLEGMFDIGSKFTMRSLAQATVKKAQTLFPNKPHAAVFEKHFKKHKILK